MSKIIKSWSVLLKVINAHWDSHGSVGSAFGSGLLIPCVPSALPAVQVILRVLLHIVVDAHVVGLPYFGGPAGCIVVTLFVYLEVVVSTTQRLLVVSSVRVLYRGAARSLRSLVVAAVQRIHYRLVRLALQTLTQARLLLGLVGNAHHLVVQIRLRGVVVGLLALVLVVVHRSLRLVDELRVASELVVSRVHHLVLASALLVHAPLRTG